MDVFSKVRDVLTGNHTCPPEHLAAYQRIGEQVNVTEMDLQDAPSPRVQAILSAARALYIMANAMLGDVGERDQPLHVAKESHEVAESWFAQLPDVLIAARQEAKFPGSASLRLPVQIGRKEETGRRCPLSHLDGMRRAASEVDDWLQPRLTKANESAGAHKDALLLYEAARVKRQSADAIIGRIAHGEHVSAESHEEAEALYWVALQDALMVAQAVADATISVTSTPQSIGFAAQPQDTSDPWRITSKRAIAEIRRDGEWDEADRDLREFWDSHHAMSQEREYERDVQGLLQRGDIVEDGYWFCCPFQSVFRVVRGTVHVAGYTVRQDHVFVWDYGEDGAPAQFISRSSFQKADSRHYCED